MAPLNFNPSTDIPDLNGKIIFITGGTSGIGRETILYLAAHHPSHIYFSGRSQASADKLVEELKTKHASVPATFIQIDLASISSVKAGAATFLAQSKRLDIFFANAGIMAYPPGLTPDGYEIQFGTNHVGHAALVKLLIPVLEAAAAQTGDVRVIWTSSLAARIPSTIQFNKLKTAAGFSAPLPIMTEWYRYGQSKLANILYARALAQHYPSITSIALHPGVGLTGLMDHMSLFNKLFIYVITWNQAVPPEQCAWNQLWAATAAKGKSKRMVESGVYYEPVGVKGDLTKAESDEELAEKLWAWTQEELGNLGI